VGVCGGGAEEGHDGRAVTPVCARAAAGICRHTALRLGKVKDAHQLWLPRLAASEAKSRARAIAEDWLCNAAVLKAVVDSAQKEVERIAV